MKPVPVKMEYEIAFAQNIDRLRRYINGMAKDGYKAVPGSVWVVEIYDGEAEETIHLYSQLMERPVQ